MSTPKIEVRLNGQRGSRLLNGDQIEFRVDGTPVLGIDVVTENGGTHLVVGRWPDGEVWEVLIEVPV